MQKKYISSLLLTALMLSGCNGSDNNKTSPSEPPPAQLEATISGGVD